MIRSVKLSLRKSIGVKCLSRNELETTLHEIEACINSRPLTFVGEELHENPLSPSHFLIMWLVQVDSYCVLVIFLSLCYINFGIWIQWVYQLMK